MSDEQTDDKAVGNGRPDKAAADGAAQQEAPESGAPVSVDQAAGRKQAAASVEKRENMSEKTSSSNHAAGSGETARPVVVKSGSGVALGALVLSLLALGASGFLFVEGQNQLKNQDLSFNQKIDAAGLGESKNAVALQESLTRIDALTKSLQVLSEQSKAQGDQLSAVNKAYQELVKTRADWLVDEIEATLNLAAQQLVIANNVPVAVRVLESLETRLARFDQPQLLPIKQAISSDLSNLKNRPYLDVAGVSLRLNRLETAVSGLPLVLDSNLKPGENAPAAIDPNASWWQRTRQSVMNSLKGMVEVRHIGNGDAMLMSPDQVYFVRENLRLRLMDARLALMQRSGEVYLSDLNTIEATVKQYFDLKSATTQSWLNELAQLKTLDLQNMQGASLNASLEAVRAYQKQAGMDMTTALPDLGASDTSVQTAPPAAASEPATASDAKQGHTEAARAASGTQHGGRAL